MDTRQLRAFLKIAELGSITRAADALGIAQPSLSQQLLRLEDEVGSKLFRRTARGVTTTEVGRIFLEYARHIVETADRALEDVREVRKEPKGQVSFAMPVSVSLILGVPLVEATLKHAPSVSLRLVEAFSGHIRTWLDEGSVDLGILYDVGPLRHLSVKRLAREELYLVGPPGAFGNADAPSSVAAERLSEFPLILPGPLHGLRQFLDREAARLGVSLTVAIEIDALAHINTLVAAGHGYAILSLPAIGEDLKAGRLSAARIGGGALRRTLCLVRNPSRLITGASVRIEDLTVKLTERMIAKRRWQAELASPSD